MYQENKLCKVTRYGGPDQLPSQYLDTLLETRMDPISDISWPDGHCAHIWGRTASSLDGEFDPGSG